MKASANTRKSIGSKSAASDEVRSKDHDSLLTWLVENLGGLMSRTFGMNEATIAEKARLAGAEAVAALEDEFETLAAYADGSKVLEEITIRVGGAKLKNDGGEGPSLATREKLKKVLPLKGACLSEIERACKVTDETGAESVEVVEFEIMRQIEADGRGASRRVDQSFRFVDLWARVNVPVKLVCDGDTGYGFFDESMLVKTADALLAGRQYKLEPETRDCEVWMTVRSGEFTLGEILQELKTLQGLAGSGQQVVLVVGSVPRPMKALIEREGFRVICRSSVC